MLTQEEKDELELLELEEQEDAVPSPAPQLDVMSTVTEGASKFAKGASMGLFDKYRSAVQAAAGRDPETGGAFDYSSSFGDRYDAALKTNRARGEAFSEQHPGAALGLELTGGVMGAGKIMKAGGTASSLLKKGGNKLTRALANTTDAAAMGAVYASGADESVAEGAGTSAGFAAVLNALPFAARVSLDAMSKRRIGKTLLDKAGNFTPINLAADELSKLKGLYHRHIGNAFGGGKVAEQSKAVLNRAVARQTSDRLAGNKTVLQAAAPEGYKVTRIGREGIQDLGAAYKKAYTSAWSGATKIAKKAVEDFEVLARAYGKKTSVEGRNKLAGYVDDLDAQISAGTPEALRAFDNILRKGAKSVGKSDKDLADMITDLRDIYKGGLNKKVAEKIAVVDKTYAGYLTAFKSGGKKMADKSIFAGKDVLAASKTVGGEKKGAEGLSPLIKEADALVATDVKNKSLIDDIRLHSPVETANAANKMASTAMLGLPVTAPLTMASAGVGLGAALPIGATVARTLSTQPAQRLLAGQTNPQRLVANALRKYDRSMYADKMREMARIGAGVTSAQQAD